MEESGTNPSNPPPFSVEAEADFVLLEAPLRMAEEVSFTMIVRMSPTARARWSPKIVAVGELSDQSELAPAPVPGKRAANPINPASSTDRQRLVVYFISVMFFNLPAG